MGLTQNGAWLLFFDDNSETLKTFFDIFGDLILFGDEFHDTGKSFLEEIDVHILGSTAKEKVDFDAMAFFEPF